MDKAINSTTILWDTIQQYTFVLLVMCLPWPIRMASAAAVLCMIVFLMGIRKPPFFTGRSIRILGLCMAYFLLHIVYWGVGEGFSLVLWPEVEKKLGLLIFPLLLLREPPRSGMHYEMLYKGYILSVAAACLLCVGIALLRFGIDTSQPGWYYHAFCKPIQQHAVYFSFQILVAIILLKTTVKQNFPMLLQIVLYVIFGTTLLLLSSKIMLAALLVLLLLWGWIAHRNQTASKSLYPVIFILLILLIAFGGSQVKSRFSDIHLDRLSMLQQESFTATTYFDGFSLRLLQLKFAAQILHDTQSWLWGVGPFKAQPLLNEAYRNAQMYIGQDGNGGYLGLNFHNQYAETLVRFGIAGLAVLMGLLGYLWYLALRCKNKPLIWICFLLTVFFCTESVLETQRGLMAMLVLPFLIYIHHYHNKSTYEM